MKCMHYLYEASECACCMHAMVCVCVHVLCLHACVYNIQVHVISFFVLVGHVNLCKYSLMTILEVSPLSAVMLATTPCTLYVGFCPPHGTVYRCNVE